MLKRVFVLVCCVLSLLAGERVIVSFDKPLPAQRMIWGGAVADVGAPGRLGVVFKVGDPWPGVSIKPDGAAWDFSDAGGVAVEVKNTGTTEYSFGFRIDSEVEDKRDLFGAEQASVLLKPGETGEIRFMFHHYGKPAFELEGMRGVPEEIGGQLRRWMAIKPEAISEMRFFCKGDGQEHRAQFGPIRVYGEPQPTLYKPSFNETNFFPFIDRLGQFIHRDWPGKLKSEAEFPQRLAAEKAELAAHKGAGDWDRWGGWQGGPQRSATGYFRTEKIGDGWWLVDPDGRLFFSMGMDCVNAIGSTRFTGRDKWFAELPPKDGLFTKCYTHWNRGPAKSAFAGKPIDNVDFCQANVIRKYGAEWEARHGEMSHDRLRSWGFNTIGNWSSEKICRQDRTPYFLDVPLGVGMRLQGGSGFMALKCPDPFEKGFGEKLRQALRGKLAFSLEDPWCIGYFVNNEIHWGTPAGIGGATLAAAPELPAKAALLAQLQTTYKGSIAALNAAWGAKFADWEAVRANRETLDKLFPECGGKLLGLGLTKSIVEPLNNRLEADLKAFGERLAECYFSTIKSVIKAEAPHHLYAGCRFAAWRNRNVERVAAKYCDIVSYNIYGMNVEAYDFLDYDCPILIGEYHFGALDRGLFHAACRGVASQEARGEALQAYVRSVFGKSRLVGCHWFKYRDQPSTGRVMDTENYQLGFVDVCDTPYPEIIAASRELAAGLYRELSAVRKLP